MLATIPASSITTSPVSTPKKKGTKSANASPRVKKESGAILKGKKVKKTILDGESLQQILIKTNGEFAEPMHIVLASPVKHQSSTTSYSPIAPATNKKNNNEPTSSWLTTNISQPTKNAQALALRAVVKNQGAKVNFQQQSMDTGKKHISYLLKQNRTFYEFLFQVITIRLCHVRLYLLHAMIRRH